jgi:hypothetical protein
VRPEQAEFDFELQVTDLRNGQYLLEPGKLKARAKFVRVKQAAAELDLTEAGFRDLVRRLGLLERVGQFARKCRWRVPVELLQELKERNGGSDSEQEGAER